MDVVDLKAALSKLKMLARTPTTAEEELKKGGAIFLVKFSGAWERHPRGDEIVQIIEGATTLHMITSQGRQSAVLSAGMMLIVPQNAWHQFESPDGVCVMTATPQPTEHVRPNVDDPRAVSEPNGESRSVQKLLRAVPKDTN